MDPLHREPNPLPDARYDALKDFTPITLFRQRYWYWSFAPSPQAKTLQSYWNTLKANPGIELRLVPGNAAPGTRHRAVSCASST
jgi:hypothetical protein